VVAAVVGYLRDLQADGRSEATQRSYAMDLLCWFRFLWAIEVGWERATRLEARDFCCWIQVSDKPSAALAACSPGSGGDLAGAGRSGKTAGVPNAVMGKPSPGLKYASATVAHCETVLRSFYEFHLEAGSGPIVNPFSLVRGQRAGRANRTAIRWIRSGRSGRAGTGRGWRREFRGRSG